MKTKSTILIVDDTDTNIDVLLELLDESYDILVAVDGNTALDIASKEDVDLILLDIMMPVMDGYEVCQRLKENQNTKSIPIVFITAKTDEDSIERAYDVGGSDYISKPFKPKELFARVRTQLKLKALINHLDFIATHDEMTGIYNRRKFFDLASKKFKESKEGLFAVMIDIDKFKLVNDTYGHSIGDKVIKMVTKTISESIPQQSVFGRIGGEEFALVCHADSRDKLLKDIEALREMIANLEPLAYDGAIVKCTISEGVAQANEDTKTLDELLKEADSALYEAKGSGRNKVIFR